MDNPLKSCGGRLASTRLQPDDHGLALSTHTTLARHPVIERATEREDAL